MAKHELVKTEQHPKVGDEVLYHADERWVSAEIIAIHPSGELALHYECGKEFVRQRSSHGSQLYGWVTYEEAAEGATRQAEPSKT